MLCLLFKVLKEIKISGEPEERCYIFLFSGITPFFLSTFKSLAIINGKFLVTNVDGSKLAFFLQINTNTGTDVLGSEKKHYSMRTKIQVFMKQSLMQKVCQAVFTSTEWLPEIHRQDKEIFLQRLKR